MKRAFALLSALVFCALSCDAFAEGAKKSFREKMSGYEFGLGVPLMTPLTGYNMFVGYVNKNANSFWGKRLGVRLDFTISSPLEVNAKLRDNNIDRYDIDVNIKPLWMNIKRSGVTDIEYPEDDVGRIALDPNAIKPSFTLENQNIGLLLDFYPFGNTWFAGGIRLSGGYYFGELELDANVKTSENIDYKYAVGNAGDYLHAQIQAGSRVGAKYRWNYQGPYVGLGFDLGIWRGFKIFMDAGVVFSNAPRFTTRNIDDQHFVLKGRYEIHDVNYDDNSEMITIMNGAEKPVVEDIVHDTIGQSVVDVLSDPGNPYGSVVADILTQYGVPGLENVDVSALADDVMNYLDNDVQAPWIENLIDNYAGEDLQETITDIKTEWHSISDKATAGVQQDINDAWDDYEKSKRDAVDDINKVLKEVGIVPMIKIGFMFRF